MTKQSKPSPVPERRVSEHGLVRLLRACCRLFRAYVLNWLYKRDAINSLTERERVTFVIWPRKIGPTWYFWESIKIKEQWVDCLGWWVWTEAQRNTNLGEAPKEEGAPQPNPELRDAALNL